MALVITINSIDRTDDIDQESLTLEMNLTKSPSTLSFDMIGVKTPLPTTGLSVVLSEDGTDIFKGTITERSDDLIGGQMLQRYSFICMDGFYEMDRQLVTKAYNDTDAVAVATDIVTNFMTGFTISAPTTSPSINTARFNYEQPTRCLTKLANEVGWDWYVDASNVVHFFPESDLVAPVEIQDDNGTLEYRTLNFDSNVTELRNRVFVRGGSYEDPISESEAVDKYESNGEDNTFPLVYRYSNVGVTVDGVVQDVGVDFINDPADHDCLYNFQEKLVRFPDGTLSAGEVVRVFGDAKIPLVVQAEDPDSINTYGVREGIEIDKAIDSIEEAELLAFARVDQWKEGSREGGFSSKQTGWIVGQTLTINSTKFGVNTTYKINKVRGRINGHDEFIYHIDFLKSGQTTFTDIVIGLIGKTNEEIEISPNEVLQRFRKVDDAFSFSDEIISQTSDSPPYHYGPVTSGNEAKYNFSTYT
jgi:hypothetical protein